MDASIIILTLNAGEIFDEVLKRVYANKSVDSFEVLVIDSGSKDSTIDIAKRYPVQLYKIAPCDFHYGKTKNYGASLSKGNFLVFLSQDAIPVNEEWLMRLIFPLKEENVAGVFGRQIPHNTNIFESYFLSQTYPDYKIIKCIKEKKAPLRLRDIFFSGVNFAIKREVWIKYKFDEQIIMCEDQEWSKKVLLGGYKIVYEPKAIVWHSHNYGLIRIFKREFDLGTSLRILTEDKHIDASAVKNFIDYFIGEIKFIIAKKKLLKIFNLFIYEFFRISGFILGLYGHILPLCIKIHFSMHPAYWKAIKKKVIQ
jgi:rhamnosyltransferase